MIRVLKRVARRLTGRLVAVLVLGLVLFATVSAHAFWPFSGGGGDGASGLDLNKGYDVNTVVTIKGKVLSLNSDEEGGPVLIEIKASSNVICLVAGPRWYWKEHGIPLKVGDELAAHGAKAEGKDGRMYLLVQKFTNQSTGTEIILRSDDGVPAWSYLRRPAGKGGPAGGGIVPKAVPRPSGGQGLQRGR